MSWALRIGALLLGVIVVFKSLDQIKEIAEKFTAGKIVPSRVLKIYGKGKKKAKHNLVFVGNIYRILGYDNTHVFLIDFKEKELVDKDYFIKLHGEHKDLNIDGGSYGKKGNCFIGNNGISDEECLDSFNIAVFGKLSYGNAIK
jgi:hypothetical protein